MSTKRDGFEIQSRPFVSMRMKLCSVEDDDDASLRDTVNGGLQRSDADLGKVEFSFSGELCAGEHDRFEGFECIT